MIRIIVFEAFFKYHQTEVDLEFLQMSIFKTGGVIIRAHNRLCRFLIEMCKVLLIKIELANGLLRYTDFHVDEVLRAAKDTTRIRVSGVS